MPEKTKNWLTKISDKTNGIVTFPLFEEEQKVPEVDEKEADIKERRERQEQFSEKISSTLQVADQIDLANLRYFAGANMLISLAFDLRKFATESENFSKLITTEEAVNNFAERCEQQRLKYVRKMYREMSAYEFWRRLENHEIKDVYDAMGFSDPKETGGHYQEDPIFFAECRPLIERATRMAAQKYDLREFEKELALLSEKIFWRESKGDPLAASRTWHVGLAQLSSVLYNGTDFNYPRKINPFNQEEAISRGADYIARLFKSFKKDEEKIIRLGDKIDVEKILKKTAQAYNGGRAAVLGNKISPEMKNYYAAMNKDYARFSALASLESNREDL